MSASIEYTEEQLNYYRICYVTTDVLTEGLRTIFKQEWDNLYKSTLGEWKDEARNGLDFWNVESPRNRKRNGHLLTTIIRGDRAEWDCTMLFYAILYSDCIHGLYPTVKSNVDDLRLFRNEDFAHMPKGHLSEPEFKKAISRVDAAFKALGLSSLQLKLLELRNQTSFPTEELRAVLKKVDDLKQELQEKGKELQEKGKELQEKGKELQEKGKELKQKGKELKQKEKELQDKEDQRQVLEEQLKSRISPFCVLPPKPSHTVASRESEVLQITQQLKELKSANENSVSSLYISGNPGSGKSQLAGLVAKRFFDEVKDSPFTTSFVMTLNAENSKTLLESYVNFARHLKCPEYAVTNTVNSKDLSTDEKIFNLNTLISIKIELYTSWLLVVDNVTDLTTMSVYLPDPGNEQWVNGQILITTQDTAPIPLTSTFTQHISVSKGMRPRDASCVLATLSGITDSEMENEVAKVLDYQPLALASAATYVRQVRQNKLTSGFGWSDYLTKLDVGQRDTTETILAEINPSYRKSMTAAITLAVKKAMTSDRVIGHTFNFLSLCAPQPLHLNIVMNYILNVDKQFQDKEMITIRIQKCSLLLFQEEESGVYIRIHQVVLRTINSLTRDYTENEQVKAVNAAIGSFTQYIEDEHLSDDCDNLDSVADSKHIAPHLVTLIMNIKHFYTEEGLCQDAEVGILTNLYNSRSFEELGEICNKHCEFEAAKDYHGRALAIRLEKLGPDHVHVAGSYINLGIIHQILGDLKQAKDYFDRALAIRLEKLGPEHVDVAAAYNNLGYVHQKLGDLKQAKYYHGRALAILLEKLGPDHVHVATSYSNLGIIHQTLGDLKQAKDYYDGALAIRLEKLGPEHVDVAAAYNNLGYVHQTLGDLKQAKDYFDRALAIRLEKLGPEHVDVAAAYNNLGYVHQTLGDLKQAKDYFDRALATRLEKLGPDHVDVAGSYIYLGIIHQTLGDLKQAKDYFDRALAIRLEKLGPEHVDVAAAYNNLGYVHQKLGDLKQAKYYHGRALAILLEKLGPDHVHVATSYSNLGIIHQTLGDLKQAKDYYDGALAIRLEKLGPEHVDVAAAYNNLGYIHQTLGDLKQAKDYFDRALAIRLEKLGPEHVDVAADYNNLGSVHQKLGDLKQAKDYHGRALAIFLEKLGPDHVYVATSYNNLGIIHQTLGDLKQAKDYFDRALAIRLEKLGPEHIDVAAAYINLGFIHQTLGDLKQAKYYCDRALAIRLEKLGPEHVDVAAAYNNLGYVHEKLGDLKQAKYYCDRALAIRLEKLGPEHVDVAAAYNNLGYVHQTLGDLKQAKDYHDRALAIRLEKLGPEHFDVAAAYNNLGYVHEELGDLKQAKDDYDRALVILLKKLGPEHAHAKLVSRNLARLQRKRESHSPPNADERGSEHVRSGNCTKF